MTIIALGGRAGAGKDTFADTLVRKHNFKKVALADSLRELCSKVFRIPFADFSEHGKKDVELDYKVELDFHHIDKIRDYLENEWNYQVTHEAREAMEEKHGEELKTPRDILRCVGNLLRSHIDDNIWISLAVTKVREAGGKVIITDCRFENERDAFSKMGALLILIKRGDKGAGKEHEFDLGEETDYDVVFDNSGTLNELQSNADMWYTLRRNELELYQVFKYV